MRGRDHETGEFLDESRSAKRREALDVLAMAGKLMDTGHAALALLPMPEELRALVVDSQRIRSNIARKRQTQWLAKQMRREDDAVLDTLRKACMLLESFTHAGQTIRLVQSARIEGDTVDDARLLVELLPTESMLRPGKPMPALPA